MPTFDTPRFLKLRIAIAFGSDVIVVDWVADEASPGAVRFITSRLQTS